MKQNNYKEIDEEFKNEFPDEIFTSAHVSWLPEKILDFIHLKLKIAREEQVEKWGFYGLVREVRKILDGIYPLNIFDGSSGDTGPRFTAKLHEAFAILDENKTL